MPSDKLPLGILPDTIEVLRKTAYAIDGQTGPIGSPYREAIAHPVEQVEHNSSINPFKVVQSPSCKSSLNGATFKWVAY